PSGAVLRAYLTGHGSHALGGPVFLLKIGSEFLLGPKSGWFLQRRLSECRCIPESRTHGTTSWWTCCVSNLNRVIDPTTDWASTSTFFKACTLPPDEPIRSSPVGLGTLPMNPTYRLGAREAIMTN